MIQKIYKYLSKWEIYLFLVLFDKFIIDIIILFEKFVWFYNLCKNLKKIAIFLILEMFCAFSF